MRDEPDQGASNRRVAGGLYRPGIPPRARNGSECLLLLADAPDGRIQIRGGEVGHPYPLPRTRGTMWLSSHPCTSRTPGLPARSEDRALSHERAQSQVSRPHEAIPFL